MSPTEPSRSQRAALVKDPEEEPGLVERVASAVMREAIAQMSKGGNKALWAAVFALSVAVGLIGGGLYLHVQGDGSVRDKTDRTNRLVVWLVRCEQARQRGEAPPPLPFEEL